jgi:hypothetical protein
LIRDGFGDNFFSAAVRVHLCGIDERHPQIDSEAQRRHLFFAVALVFTHAPCALAERGDHGGIAKSDAFHNAKNVERRTPNVQFRISKAKRRAKNRYDAISFMKVCHEQPDRADERAGRREPVGGVEWAVAAKPAAAVGANPNPAARALEQPTRKALPNSARRSAFAIKGKAASAVDRVVVAAKARV